MVHSGYEPTAVQQTFGSLRGLLRAARVTLFGLGPKPSPSEASSLPLPGPHYPMQDAPELVPLEYESTTPSS